MAAAYLAGNIDSRAAIGPTLMLTGIARSTGTTVPGDLLDRYAQAAATNANIRHALADLRSALSLSDDTAFYCYRALESLRQEFIDDSDPRPAREKRSWERLRAALGVDEERARELAALATPRRHGANPHLPYDVRRMWLEWTRELVAIYIEADR
ncbi:hypothetical protein ACFYT3_31500 [Nocardia amikacinitolerans]|uniref:hypothetical protein n=1 Tax=Nocardia amikacinitolerans TaxID=756689 RepID=UPI0036937046